MIASWDVTEARLQVFLEMDLTCGSAERFRTALIEKNFKWLQTMYVPPGGVAEFHVTIMGMEDLESRIEEIQKVLKETM